MIKKLFYDEYESLTSYYQGGTYANPGNQLVPYDEVAAVQLLEEAGWKELDADGYRVKDGQRLKLTVTYSSPLSERSLTVFQEACKTAGIELELQLLSPAAAWKNFQEKEYQLEDAAWGALVFPNPETSWHSALADQKNNNNVTGFKNARVDELCAAYDREYDVNRRIEIIREIDGILFQEFPYVLGWYGPSQRVLFWNKFGMPAWGTSRYAESDNMFALWWVDPEKEKQLAASRQDAAATMDAGAREVHFWEQWVAAQRAAPVGGSAAPTAPATDGAGH
jgi:microcin C transport system substrate-binding protein